MKIALIVGHTKKAQGATNYKGESEYSFNSRIADKLVAYINKVAPHIEVKIFFRDSIGRSGAVRLVKEWRADLCLELHFNSYKRKAYGCEVLVHHRETASIKVADDLTDAIEMYFGIKQRGDNGVKKLKDGDRAYYNVKLMQGIPVGMIVEPCFADYPTSDSRAIFEDEEKYVSVLGSCLIRAVDKDYDNNIEQEVEPDEPVQEAEVDLPPLPEEDAGIVGLLNYLNQEYPDRVGEGSPAHVALHIIKDHQKKISELMDKKNKAERIANDQNKAWDHITSSTTECIKMMEDSILKVIKDSQDTWIRNS